MQDQPIPARLECPGCGGSSFTAGPDDSFTCNSCHAVYILPERERQTRGQEPGMLDALFVRATTATTDWLQQQRDEAPAIKAQQEAASQARLAEMWAADERRREGLARAQAEHDRRQKIIVATTVALVAVFVIAAIVLAAFAASRTSPHFFF